MPAPRWRCPRGRARRWPETAVLSDAAGGRTDRSAELRIRRPRRPVPDGRAKAPCSWTRRRESVPRHERSRYRGGAEHRERPSPRTALPCPAARLFLLLEQVIVFLDEPADLVGHSQELLPLLAVQGDGKAAQPIDGKGAFLADLHSHLAARPLERLVFGAEAFQFGL